MRWTSKATRYLSELSFKQLFSIHPKKKQILKLCIFLPSLLYHLFVFVFLNRSTRISQKARILSTNPRRHRQRKLKSRMESSLKKTRRPNWTTTMKAMRRSTRPSPRRASTLSSLRHLSSSLSVQVCTFTAGGGRG